MILALWQQSANINQTAKQPEPVIPRNALFLPHLADLTSLCCRTAFYTVITFICSGVQNYSIYRLGQEVTEFKLVSRDLPAAAAAGAGAELPLWSRHPRQSTRVKFLCRITVASWGCSQLWQCLVLTDRSAEKRLNHTATSSLLDQQCLAMFISPTWGWAVFWGDAVAVHLSEPHSMRQKYRFLDSDTQRCFYSLSAYTLRKA